MKMPSVLVPWYSIRASSKSIKNMELYDKTHTTFISRFLNPISNTVRGELHQLFWFRVPFSIPAYLQLPLS